MSDADNVGSYKYETPLKDYEYVTSNPSARYANPLLNKREKTHGSFSDVAVMSQAIKDAMRIKPHWSNVPPEMRESLDMFAVKMARIVCGDARAVQHIEDIEGYATLARGVCRD